MASSSRQTETNTTVNTESNSIQSYAQNSQYYTENSNDEREYYEHEEHSKHHHVKENIMIMMKMMINFKKIIENTDENFIGIFIKF